jgi:hypothetical protein
MAQLPHAKAMPKMLYIFHEYINQKYAKQLRRRLYYGK